MKRSVKHFASLQNNTMAKSFLDGCPCPCCKASFLLQLSRASDWRSLHMSPGRYRSSPHNRQITACRLVIAYYDVVLLMLCGPQWYSAHHTFGGHRCARRVCTAAQSCAPTLEEVQVRRQRGDYEPGPSVRSLGQDRRDEWDGAVRRRGGLTLNVLSAATRCAASVLVPSRDKRVKPDARDSADVDHRLVQSSTHRASPLPVVDQFTRIASSFRRCLLRLPILRWRAKHQAGFRT